MSLLYGLHDRQAVSHVPVDGWCVDTVALSQNPPPQQYGGRINWIVRLNHGYGSTGTIPLPGHYQEFANACADYVARSSGANIWIIGNEPNHQNERPNGVYITPDQYARCFAMCRDAIKRVRSTAQVIPAPCAPYHADPVDWLVYWLDMLKTIARNGGCDGIAVHAYTRSSNPADISSGATMGGVLGEQFSGFRTYQNALDLIPDSMRHLPAYITEFNELLDGGWHDANTGVVQAAYAEIDSWNRMPKTQKVHALILYRWPKFDQWYIEGKQGVIDDFNAATGRGDTSPVKRESDMTETLHIPLVSPGTVTAPDLPPRDIDPRATARGVTVLTPRGIPLTWRVKSVRWYDEQEADRLGPDHHIMADVLDELGNRLTNVPLLVRWPTGEHRIVTEAKPGEPYSANYPMSPSRNEFSIVVDGLALSEVVSGIGMGMDTPGGFNAGVHTTTGVVFQRVGVVPSVPSVPHAPTGPTPAPTTAYVIVLAGANLRQTPDVRPGNILVAVPYGEMVTVTGEKIAGNGTRWAQVRYQGMSGWITAGLLGISEPAPVPISPDAPELIPVGDTWQRTIAFILKEEGGYTANDEGAPANFGINQGANPDLDVKNITREQAIERYHTKYWQGSGADKLEWPACLLVMDAAVQHGQGIAAQLWRDSGGDLWLFQGNRQLFYAQIKQDSWARNGKAWMARMGRLLVEASK